MSSESLFHFFFSYRRETIRCGSLSTPRYSFRGSTFQPKHGCLSATSKFTYKNCRLPDSRYAPIAPELPAPMPSDNEYTSQPASNGALSFVTGYESIDGNSVASSYYSGLPNKNTAVTSDIIEKTSDELNLRRNPIYASIRGNGKRVVNYSRISEELNDHHFKENDSSPLSLTSKSIRSNIFSLSVSSSSKLRSQSDNYHYELVDTGERTTTLDRQSESLSSVIANTSSSSNIINEISENCGARSYEHKNEGDNSHIDTEPIYVNIENSTTNAPHTNKNYRHDLISGDQQGTRSSYIFSDSGSDIIENILHRNQHRLREIRRLGIKSNVKQNTPTSTNNNSHIHVAINMNTKVEEQDQQNSLKNTIQLDNNLRLAANSLDCVSNVDTGTLSFSQSMSHVEELANEFSINEANNLAEVNTENTNVDDPLSNDDAFEMPVRQTIFPLLVTNL